MGIIEDLLKALDRVPLWKRLGEVPGEVDDLKQRVTAVEQKLSGKWPGEVCKLWGASTAYDEQHDNTLNLDLRCLSGHRV